MNIPKKLSVRSYGAVDFSWFKKYKDEMVPNAEAHEEVINKINELIDYLQAKEEASKEYKDEIDKDKLLVCKNDGIYKIEKVKAGCISSVEASKGECICCSNKHLNRGYSADGVCGKCKHDMNPPEHEEVDVDKLYSRGMDRLRINNYIKANFVSKEKIKRYASKNKYRDVADSYENGHNQALENLVNFLGLGD